MTEEHEITTAVLKAAEAGRARVEAAVAKALAAKALHQELAEGVGICLLVAGIALCCAALAVGLVVLGGIAVIVFAGISAALAVAWALLLLLALIRKVFAPIPKVATNG